MKRSHAIELFTQTFQDSCRVAANLSKDRTFTSFCNILYFCISVVQNAMVIAKCDKEDGRDFIRALYEQIIQIPSVSVETISFAIDKLAETREEDLKIALKYFQSLARFVRMRSKKIPSPETVSLLFIAEMLKNENTSCGQTIQDFLKKLNISVSYKQVCKTSKHNQKCKKNADKYTISRNWESLEIASSKIPNVCLKNTPVYHSPQE